jgi:hypothetical protein
MIKLTCPEHGVHYPWLPRVTRALAMLDLSDQEIFDELREAISRVQHRKISEAEIKDVIALIRGKSRDCVSAGNVVYEPEYLRAVAGRIAEPVDEAYLEARGQFTCWNRTPAGFLHKLYQPGEHVWITTRPRSGEGEIWTHDGFNQRFDELNHLVNGHAGVWFLTNPVDSELHSVERRKSKHNPDGLSFSTLECIISWRFLMFETDVAPRELWRKALVQMRLPIVGIYDSGRNGDHVLVRLQAHTKTEWETFCAQYDQDLIRLGACPGSLTARRLSRLPNCIRGQTGQMQQLLYLCPDADGTPICKRPRRLAIRGTVHNYEEPDL